MIGDEVRLDARLVAETAARLAPHVRRTPVERSDALSTLTGADVFLKLENLQHTGAFKVRGALAKLAALSPAVRARGVLTASAGNHGQGVAFAARLFGAPSCVVLPEGVPLAKLTAVQRLGAEVVVEGDGYDAAAAYAVTLATARGMTYVHAFDDPDVIAGQGSLALELAADVADLDAVLVPVGGGGLLAGIALGLERVRPRPRLVGVQSDGARAFADSFAASALVERPAATIADGIAVRRPGALALGVARERVDEVRTVTDEAIARAIVLLLERHKLLAEGAGAAGIAALLADPAAFAGKRVAVVVSGGNIDPNLLAKVVQQGLASAGRYLAFRTWLDDKPGMLHGLTAVLTAERINILHVGIDRLGPYTALGKVGLDVIVETRDRAHAAAVLALVRAHGFPAEELLDTRPGRRE